MASTSSGEPAPALLSPTGTGQTRRNSLLSEPAFAVTCSFFNKFGSVLGFKPLSFTKIENLFNFDQDGRVDKDLVDIIVKLLRRIGIYGVSAQKWEKALLKFCSVVPSLQPEFHLLENYGYAHSSLAIKLHIMQVLCEKQFDFNPKFKEQITQVSASDLRLLPVGVDKNGQCYWYQMDQQLNLRIYCEEPDDSAGTTWTIRASDRDALATLIESLTGNTTNLDESVVDEENNEDSEESKSADNNTHANNENNKQSNTQQCKESKGDVAPISEDVVEDVKPSISQVIPQENSPKVIKDEHTQCETVKEPTENEESNDKNEIISKVDVKTEVTKPIQVNITQEKDTNIKDEEKEDQANKDEVENKDQVNKVEVEVENKEEENKDEEIKDEEEKEEKPSPQKKPLKMKTKKGTFMDVTPLEIKPKVEKITNSPVEEDNKDAHDNYIPEELKPFIERRILPRRSCRVKPADQETPNGTKTTPSKSPQKTTPNKKSKPQVLEEEEEEEEEEKEKVREEGQQSSSDNSSDESNSDEMHTDDDDYKPLSILRRGGKRRKRMKFSEGESECGSDQESKPLKARKKATEETFCTNCSLSKDPHVLLLCDKCDDAWHTWCLKPQLWYVPDEDWYCPKCQHSMLIEKLTAALKSLDEQLVIKKVEDEKKKKQRDRFDREMRYIDINLKNIMPVVSDDKENYASGTESESEEEVDSEVEDRRARERQSHKAKRRILPLAMTRTKRQTKKVDYSFKEYDDAVLDAVEEIQENPKRKFEDPARPQGGAGKGKDMANILSAMGKEQDSQKEEGKAEKDDEYEPDEQIDLGNNRPQGGIGKPPSALLAKRKPKKLNDLDVDNQTESDTDEYKATEESEVDEDDLEESASEDEWLPGERNGSRKSQRLRVQRELDRNFVVDGSESDEYKPNKRKPAKSKRLPVKKKRKRKVSDDDSDSEDSIVRRARKRTKKKKTESSEDEYAPSKSDRSRTKRSVNYRALAGSTSSEEGEGQVKQEAKDQRPTGALTRKTNRKSDESYSEKSEEEVEEEKDPSLSEDEEQLSSPSEKKHKKIESSEEDELTEEPQQTEISTQKEECGAGEPSSAATVICAPVAQPVPMCVPVAVCAPVYVPVPVVSQCVLQPIPRPLSRPVATLPPAATPPHALPGYRGSPPPGIRPPLVSYGYGQPTMPPYGVYQGMVPLNPYNMGMPTPPPPAIIRPPTQTQGPESLSDALSFAMQEDNYQ